MRLPAEKLEGRTVTAVFREQLDFGVARDVVALQLDDGTILYAMADAEGNGAGALYLDDAKAGTSRLVV